jgi:hypothetical protein
MHGYSDASGTFGRGLPLYTHTRQYCVSAVEVLTSIVIEVGLMPHGETVAQVHGTPKLVETVDSSGK